MDRRIKIILPKKLNFPSSFFQNARWSDILEAVRRGGEVVTQESAKLRCASSILARASIFMEKETGEILTKDQTGFSEKQLDINVEIGIFKSSKNKKIKKILFEKKRKK